MKATSRFAPSASSPRSVELPSASTWSALILSPRRTIGLWWISVPWFERMNFVIEYSSLPSFVSTTIRSASTSRIVPAVLASTTSPVSTAARYSRPVPTSGACVIISGVEVDDVVRDLSARDLPVRRLDEAELRDGRERRERAHQADVRAFRRLDRAHTPVVGRVDVAHLDRRALAGQAARAERREA